MSAVVRERERERDRERERGRELRWRSLHPADSEIILFHFGRVVRCAAAWDAMPPQRGQGYGTRDWKISRVLLDSCGCMRFRVHSLIDWAYPVLPPAAGELFQRSCSGKRRGSPPFPSVLRECEIM